MPKRSISSNPRISSSRRVKKPSRRRFRLVALMLVVGLAAFGGWKLLLPRLGTSQTVLAERVVLPTAINTNFLNQVETCFIPTAKMYGYRLDIVSGWRSAAEQNAIYAVGRTEPGDIVTNAVGGKSWHNWGLAVDMADIDDGYDINWTRLTKMAAWCGLEHGDRGAEDLPHFQYRGGFSLEDMQAGKWPKPLYIPCRLMVDKKAKGQSLTKSDLRSCGAPEF